MMRAALAAAVLCGVLSQLAEAKRQRTSRDWSKMTEEDWKRVEKQWESPEEEEECVRANLTRSCSCC